MIYFQIQSLSRFIKQFIIITDIIHAQWFFLIFQINYLYFKNIPMIFIFVYFKNKTRRISSIYKSFFL